MSGSRPPAVILAVGAFLLCAAVLARFHPVDTAWIPECPFHLLTGLHCAGCGTLRGLHHLFNGEFRLALSHNPLMIASLPLIAVLIAEPALRGTHRLAQTRWLPWFILVIICLFWVLRNLPLFSWLAPPPVH